MSSYGGERPEEAQPAEQHYHLEEAERYTQNATINKVQRQLTERCIELLELPSKGRDALLLLDIGCGSGISGEVLEDSGFTNWVGLDVAPGMLRIANNNAAINPTDLLLADIGQRQGFREAVFDAAVSVSVVQWLCHGFDKDQNPKHRLRAFFHWLYASLAQGAKAVLQFYPSSQAQVDLVGKAAAQSGFQQCFVVDNAESSKKRKVFLVLSVGRSAVPLAMAAASTGEAAPAPKGRKGKKSATLKEKILLKKESQRKKGLEVRHDSKYTGRRRTKKF